jgi:hypothetical protein
VIVVPQKTNLEVNLLQREQEHSLQRPLNPGLDLESGEKLPQMVINNDLLVLIAKVIKADPDSWGLLRTKNHGKATVANKLVKFLSNLPNPLTQGKSATSATVAVWMKKGKELAEAETERRAAGNASGRGAAAGLVPELQRVWFELMEFWADYMKEKPRTDRYTPAPSHLRGTVELKKDDSPLLPCGREEKMAGDAMREEAISRIAEERDCACKDKPKAKEHLKPRKLKEEPGSGSSGQGGADTMLAAYVAMETARNQQEMRTAKVAELQQY